MANRPKKVRWKISTPAGSGYAWARTFGHAVRQVARLLGHQLKTDESTGGWHGVSGDVVSP